MSPPNRRPQEDLWLDALSHLAAERESPVTHLDEESAARISDALFEALTQAGPEDACLPAGLAREAELWQRVDAELEANSELPEGSSELADVERPTFMQRLRAWFTPQPGWAFAAALLVMLSAGVYLLIREAPETSVTSGSGAGSGVSTSPEIASTPALPALESRTKTEPPIIAPVPLDHLVIQVDEPLRHEEMIRVARAMTGAVARSSLGREPAVLKGRPRSKKHPRREPTTQPEESSGVIEPLEEAVEESGEGTPVVAEKAPRLMDALATEANMIASEQQRYFQRVSEGCRLRAAEDGAGRIVIDVHIDTRGEVVRTGFVNRDLSLELAQCLERRVKSWTFKDANKTNFQMVFKFRARVKP